MKVTLPEFERAGVMVVGDVMLDRYWYGPTSRISPEAPVPNTFETFFKIQADQLLVAGKYP